MLKKLTVSNLAIVERVEVDFASGLNVITGETGAGKSVLMGALELVLGGRAEASVVREGATEAEVEAVFEKGKSKDAGEEIVIRRTVTASGRSRAWINDESVSIAELKELGATLVDIHGPTANQHLVEESFQRAALDGYSRVKIGDYATCWSAYSDFKSQIEELNAAGGEDELDMLRFQVGELRAADLCEDDATLSERHAAAAHAEEIVENANAITEGLGGDRSAAEILIQLQPKFHAMARHLPSAEEWAKEADELTVRVQELSRTVADAVSRMEAGEEDLAALDARLTLVNRLLRKYHVAQVADLMALVQTKEERLDALEHRGERLEELQRKLAAAEKELRAAGAALTKARTAAAEKLGKAVTKELRDLGFLQAKFFVAIEPGEPTATGLDRVVYMFAPNPGEPARPLAAIASSGEIARVMLALKVATNSAVHLHLSPSPSPSPTLVFDEIDANIGGEVGKAVGEKLRQVAQGHQIIAITHLPQSAAFGERHLVVAKAVEGGRTRTKISEVAGEARVLELARMLGGVKLTSVVKRHAEELLQLSR